MSDVIMTTFKTQIYLTKDDARRVKELFGLRRVYFNYALDQIYRNNVKSTMSLLQRYYDEADSGKLARSLEAIDLKYGRIQHLYKEIFEDASEAVKAAAKKNRKKKTNVRVDYHRKKDRLETVSLYSKNPSTIRPESSHRIEFILNKLLGRISVRTRESVEFLKTRTDKIRTITITRRGGKYWMSITYARTKRVVNKPDPNTVIGIDLGIAISAVTFDGQSVDKINFNTKGSVRSEQLANRVDLSRKREGSKRYEKAVQLKKRRYMRSQAQRLAEVDNFISYLCKNHHTVVIDNFSFKGALKVADNAKTYRSMKGAFITRLEQKAIEYDTQIVFIPHTKGVKTTHVCSKCGSVGILVDKKTRQVYCKDCQTLMDRDENGARNTYAYYVNMN